MGAARCGRACAGDQVTAPVTVQPREWAGPKGKTSVLYLSLAEPRCNPSCTLTEKRLYLVCDDGCPPTIHVHAIRDQQEAVLLRDLVKALPQ